MPYYCKKCGSVVTGKFCSCCGTRATDDFTDFKKAQRRMEREIKNAAWHDCRIAYGNGTLAMQCASLAFNVAFNRLIPGHALRADRFDQYSEYLWKKLPECQELAELLYERAIDLLQLKK